MAANLGHARGLEPGLSLQTTVADKQMHPQLTSLPTATAAAASEAARQPSPLEWFFEKLQPTDQELKPILPDGNAVPDPLPTAVLKKLAFVAVSVSMKRGLTPETCAALGFRANFRENECLLRAMRALFDWDALLDSGLWLEADPKRNLDRRPNSQYFGLGLVGRRPESERRHRDEKHQWGWSQPILIPYFDAAGRLVKLRPHKAGAAGGTHAGAERLYVPRALPTGPGTPVSLEKFSTVIVCEGEFKAAAIWQEIGAGARLNYGDPHPAVGVCALPGISFARNLSYRGQLGDWLRAVGCRRAIVAFDDEEKHDKPLRQRLDAAKYSRYLAQHLSRHAHVAGMHLRLPGEWRNSKGKADWDGALAKLLEQRRAAQTAPTPEATR